MSKELGLSPTHRILLDPNLSSTLRSWETRSNWLNVPKPQFLICKMGIIGAGDVFKFHSGKRNKMQATLTPVPLCWEKGKCVYMHTRVNSFQYAGCPSEDMLGEVSLGSRLGWQRERPFLFIRRPICEVCTCNMSMYY